MSASGPFSSYLTNGMIGAPGTSLGISFLIREDVSNGDTNAVFLNPSSISWEVGSANNIGIGYFGRTANRDLQYNNDTPVLSNVPVTQDQPTLMVVEAVFGSTNNVYLWVNPSSAQLGGANPSTSTANAMFSTASSVAFQGTSYECGYSTNDGSLADIRLGTTFAAVTP